MVSADGKSTAVMGPYGPMTDSTLVDADSYMGTLPTDTEPNPTVTMHQLWLTIGKPLPMSMASSPCVRGATIADGCPTRQIMLLPAKRGGPVCKKIMLPA